MRTEADVQWLWQALESRLDEMLIEGKSCLDPLVVRRFQRNQKTGVEKICRHDPLYKWAS